VLDASSLATDAFQAHHDEGLTATLVDFVRRVGDAGRSGGAGGSGGAGDPVGVGFGAFFIAVLAFIALIAGGIFLTIFLGARRRRQEQARRTEELRRFARDDLVSLGDEVRAIDLEIEMPDADPRAREDLARALDAYERAERGFDAARRPEDFEPVTAAIEEGRWAMQSARARLAGDEPPERRPPCFFDPRHGPSIRDVQWAPPGGQPRPVPACAADAQRVERGAEPAVREVELAGGRRPYWEAPSYFGPWAGGYFGGGFGGFGGFLPGMLFGGLLGGAFGGWGHDTVIYNDFGGGDFGGGDFGGGDFGGGDFGGGDFGGGDFGGGGDF
jgi:hypothetical protein